MLLLTIIGDSTNRVQRSERFLIGRDSSGSTVGIWFYDIEECNMVYNTIKAYVRARTHAATTRAPITDASVIDVPHSLKDRLKADIPGAGGAEDGGDDLQRLFGAASKAAPARSSHMASSSDPHPLLQILHQSTDALSQPRPFDNGVGGSGGDALRTTLVGGLGAPGFEHIPLSAAGQQLPPPHGSSGAPYALAPMPSTQPSAVAVVGKEQIRASLQALAQVRSRITRRSLRLQSTHDGAHWPAVACRYRWQNQVFIDIVHHTLLNRQQQ